MPSFRRVEDARAGPSALGILVPPGLRTVVILRPRALDWDLLAIDPERGFCQFQREEAAGVARRVFRALEQTAIQAVKPMPNEVGQGFRAVIHVEEFLWIVCPRQPGKPYQPWNFTTPEEAQQAVNQLLPFLRPAPDGNQEYYFNTQNFSS